MAHDTRMRRVDRAAAYVAFSAHGATNAGLTWRRQVTSSVTIACLLPINMAMVIPESPPSLTVPAFLGITLTANIRVAPASRHVFKGAIITVRATEGSKKRHSTRDARGDLAVLKATFRLRGRAICRAACHARMTASQCPRIRHT